jgi:hypothetical protein
MCYDLYEPVVETIGSCIYGCVRTIDTDTFLSEMKEGVLLGVGKGDGLQGSEYYWVYAIVRQET